MIAFEFCKTCSCEFQPYLNRGKLTQFCTLKCYWKSMKGKPHGHKTVNGKIAWNKGMGNSTQDQLERRKFHQTIQSLVLQRDDYTCQICGEKGGKLQVDHIQSWADYVELRFSMDNCRTLCMDCHYLITWGKPKPKEIKTWGHNFRRRVIT